MITRNKVLVLSIVALMSIGLMACGSTSSGDSSSGSYTSDNSISASPQSGKGFDRSIGSSFAAEPDADVAMEEETSESTDSADPAEGAEEFEYDTSRKIIYNADIAIESKNFDEDLESIKSLVKDNGGYYSSSSLHGSKDSSSRYADLTVRVPADQYSTFVESIGGIGSVTYSSESADDITSEYVDIQARIKSLNTKMERLLALEQEAKTVEELLEIEDRINEVQYELESYEGQKKYYDDKVEYCTIDISISEVATYTEIKDDTFANRVEETLQNTFEDFVRLIQGIAIILVYLLPYIIIALIITTIVLFVTRKDRKARKEQKKKLKALAKEAKNKQIESTNKTMPKSQTGEYTGPVYNNDKPKGEDDITIQDLDK